MTQATCTQTVSVSRPKSGLATRPRIALRRLVSRSIRVDDEPENLTGFSPQYRAQLAAKKARKAEALMTMALLGRGQF